MSDPTYYYTAVTNAWQRIIVDIPHANPTLHTSHVFFLNLQAIPNDLSVYTLNPSLVEYGKKTAVKGHTRKVNRSRAMKILMSWFANHILRQG